MPRTSIKTVVLFLVLGLEALQAQETLVIDCENPIGPASFRGRGYDAYLLTITGTRQVIDEKLVIAHYMTDMVPQTSLRLNRWIDPELADPNGSTAALGGLNETVPMASLNLKDAEFDADETTLTRAWTSTPISHSSQ